jgi:hypothetical protein
MARQIPNINRGNFLIQRERLAFKQFVLKVNTDTFTYTYTPNIIELNEDITLFTLTLLNKKFIFDILAVDNVKDYIDVYLFGVKQPQDRYEIQWDDTNITLASIGSPVSQTDIYGSPVNVNGYPIEFSEDNLVPYAVGGVTQGASFATGSFYNGTTYQDWPMVEVLREILYPYIPPALTISAINNVTGTTYAEVGTTPSITLSASLTTYARDANEYISEYLISTSTSIFTQTYTGGSFSGNPGASVNFTTPGDIYGSTPSTLTPYIVDYTFAAANIWSPTSVTSSSYPYGFSYSATASIQFVSPFVISFVLQLYPIFQET